MTLTRPAYAAIITNLDTGWTQTVTAGDAYDPNAGVWLMDGLSLAWTFTGPPPAQLEPETAQFSILADGIANLPEFEVGDRVAIRLQRPTLSTPIIYMDFAGRITDSALTTEAATGRLVLELTAVDPTSELTHDVDQTFGTLSALWSVWQDAIRRYAKGGTWMYDPSTGNTDERFSYPCWSGVGTNGCQEVLQKTTAAGLNPTTGLPVTRYTRHDQPITDSGWWYGAPYLLTTAAWDFYMAQWLYRIVGTLPALFTYAWSAADGDKVTAAPAADTPGPGSMLVLDACHMPDPAEWAKDRTLAPNRLKVAGVNTSTGNDTFGYATDSADMARFGAIGRTVETWGTADPAWDVTDLAEQYLALSPSASAEAWLFGDTTILTEQMDDATLDAYADEFWTVRAPSPGIMGRPAVLVNVDPAVDPTDGYLIANLVGVTFTAENGHLHITPDLSPAPLPALTLGQTASPTYDAFGASAFGGATYHDQGGSSDYIDPALTFEKSRFTSL